MASRIPLSAIALARRAGLLMLLLALLCAGGCATLPPPRTIEATYALTDVAQTALGRIAAADVPADPAGLSGFRLLPDADFALEARLALVRRAEKSLDVQYYLIQDDEVGLLLLRALRDAAARGVRVRLLVDDFYTAGEDELFGTLAAHPNVEVRLFNPLPVRSGGLGTRLLFSLHEFARINHRMHNKQLVADNSLAVSGGRNMASEYFMRGVDANFIDMDVLSSGPIVQQMSQGFDRYWNSAQVRPVEDIAPTGLARPAAQRRFEELSAVAAAAPERPLPARDALEHAPVGQELEAGHLTRHWGTATLFVDHPAKITRSPDDAFRGSVTEQALASFGSAHSGVLIISPYFIPSKRGLAMMKQAVEHGGYVIVVTNSLGSTDEPLAYAAYARHREAMLRAGVQVREIGPRLSASSGRFGRFGKSISRLHAKLAIIDRRRLLIGSMNLDHRSADVNTETGLLIDSDGLVADYEKLFSVGRDNSMFRLRLDGATSRVQWLEYDSEGKDVVREEEPGGSWWLSLKNWLLLPLVGEDTL